MSTLVDGQSQEARTGISVRHAGSSSTKLISSLQKQAPVFGSKTDTAVVLHTAVHQLAQNKQASASPTHANPFSQQPQLCQRNLAMRSNK